MELDEVSSASGEIIPVGQVKKVQHFGGGVLSEILVQEGDYVTAGMVLIRLDPLLSQSNLDQTLAQKRSLLAKRARLEALAEGKLPDFSSMGASSWILNEERLFRQMLKTNQLTRLVLQHQVKQYKAELREVAEKEKMLIKQLTLLNEELVMRGELFKKGLNSKPLYLSLQRQLSELEGELAQVPAQKKKFREKILETKNRIKSEQSQFQETTLNELASVNHELVQSDEVLVRYQNSLDHLEIKAPVNGYVLVLKTHTIGEVIESGATIMEIVPKDRHLVAEIKISSKDVGHVRTGQEVILKFKTYDYARYGGLKGELVDISHSTLLDEGDNPFYQGLVELEKSYLGSSEKSLPVLPGLTLQADIKTGKKTILEYILKPIIASARQALRER